MTNTHIRLNRATREWVIFAPNRGIRPRELVTHLSESPPQNLKITNCPFCKPDSEFNEPVLLELPDPSGKGWLTRVVENKFPALSPALKPKRSIAGIYLELPGYGHHEIIIEGPAHNQNLALMSLKNVTAVVETYRQRYLQILQFKDVLFIIIFRNYGPKAGASQQHPHSQIIATPIVPRRYRWREDEAQRYFDELGHCAYCDILEFEADEQKRVIGENEHFIAFVPYAAEVPYEIWILPKEHRSDFGSISEAEVVTFASILREVLGKLYYKLDNPDYNYAIMSAARYKAGEPQLHWYCQIRPTLTTAAGFEMGSGISINPSLPEVDAAVLNGR